MMTSERAQDELRRRALHSYVTSALEAQGPALFDQAVEILGGLSYDVVTEALAVAEKMRTVPVEVHGTPWLRIELFADERWQGVGSLPASWLGGDVPPPARSRSWRERQHPELKGSSPAAPTPSKAQPTRPAPAGDDSPGYGLYL